MRKRDLTKLKRKAGLVRSEDKARAARVNGKLGGRKPTALSLAVRQIQSERGVSRQRAYVIAKSL